MKNLRSSKWLLFGLMIIVACSVPDDPIPLVSSFHPEDASIKENEIVEFKNNSSGNPDKWHWTFDGGTPLTSTEENPSILYEKAGEFEVILQVSRGNEENIKKGQIKVRELVQVSAAFEVDSPSIKVGESIAFTDNSEGNPKSWTWTFEGGTPEVSTDQNPIIKYETSGIYKVTFTVSNEDTENSLTKEEFIVVEEKEMVISSGFSEDADGWTIVGDAQGGSNIVASYSPFEGLDDSGYIYAEDRVTGGIWYFSAPSRFLGDKSEFYGGTMSFWLIQKSNLRNQFKEKDIVIRNDTKEIYLYHSQYSGLEWTHFDVEISEASDWLTGNNRTASKIEIEEVLSNITSLRIRGEFEYSPDTGGLDQFEMKLPQ